MIALLNQGVDGATIAGRKLRIGISGFRSKAPIHSRPIMQTVGQAKSASGINKHS
jgi:hypothetical protein